MNWESSILWGIIGLIGTIFFGYIFYLKSTKEKILLCKFNSMTVISDYITKYKGLRVTYKKKKIKQLKVSTITIKNTGNDTIDENDIAPSCHITFATTKNFLLDDIEDSEIIASNKSISVKLHKISNNKIELNFDFLKPQDMITVSLLHNGKLSVFGDLKNGTIIINDNRLYNRRLRIQKIKKAIVLGFVFLTLSEILSIIILFIIK